MKQSLSTVNRKLFSNTAMNLREWGSNSRYFVAEQDRTFGFTYKVLGVTWNSSNDMLTVCIQQTSTEFYKVRSTWCNCIHFWFTRVLFSHYFEINFMQDLWKEKWEWDVKLDDKKLQKWMENIPRYLGSPCQDQDPPAVNLTLLFLWFLSKS